MTEYIEVVPSRFAVAAHSGRTVTVSRDLPPKGVGFLAGSFPDGVTSVEGVPASAEIRVLLRPPAGDYGDGVVVASIQSNPDGTWLVAGLDHRLKYDVVCRHEGYNDMILSNVSPALATGLEFAGSFTSLDDQVEILLGVGPYQVEVVGGTPPIGVTFKAEGEYVVATGDPGNWGQFTFTLRVIDGSGLSGVFESMMDVAKPFPTIIGEPFGGGFYAGDIESEGQWYKLIVADVSADIVGANARWKTSNTDTPNASHLSDGVANTNAMIVAGIEQHPAANHCVNHSGGGYTDWYIPAKDELNVVYQNLGFNRPDCPPDFQLGGPQAFTSAFYLTSTQLPGYPGRAWIQHLNGGNSSDTSKTDSYARLRPIRRLPFIP